MFEEGRRGANKEIWKQEGKRPNLRGLTPTYTVHVTSNDIVTYVTLNNNVRIPVYREVYIPSDDTFLLLNILDVKEGEKVLEIGSGCGILSIASVLKGAKWVVSIDVNPYAVLNTKHTALDSNVYDSIDIVQLYGCKGILSEFDVIIFNPPYLPQERVNSWIEVSWAGGSKGYEVLFHVLPDVLRLLKCNGRFYTIVSSLSGGMKLVLRLSKWGLRIAKVKCRRFFFEEICAVELVKQC